MMTLRTTSIWTRLVLAWFVLVLGVAGASPIVHPQALAVVCTAGGAVKIVVAGDDGQLVDMGQHTLDCSLCLAATLPATPLRQHFATPHPLAHALQPIEAAHIAARMGAPLPPRGPPFFA